ncbi:32.2 kDa [Spodoptera frugiperda ascovirus 1a]|uniref:32.2 kDa n=1 Tax=Spodoptera frugiperda ascovirus 1a TaxID=113370 RepID=Q0E4Y4_SFAVA|nr:32.2 kDa [Spodoptera frugiperda ascovirus 1a]CAL44717.1 32.2 kDa [Spodoptera frugiperda ascovirus 1a]
MTTPFISRIESYHRRYEAMFGRCESQFDINARRYVINEILERTQVSLLQMLEFVRPPCLTIDDDDQYVAATIACLALRASAMESFDTNMDTFSASEWALLQLAIDDEPGDFQVHVVKYARSDGTPAPHTARRMHFENPYDLGRPEYTIYDMAIDYVLCRFRDACAPVCNAVVLMDDRATFDVQANSDWNTERNLLRRLRENYEGGDVTLLSDGIRYTFPLSDSVKYHVWWCLDVCVQTFRRVSAERMLGAFRIGLRCRKRATATKIPYGHRKVLDRIR